MKEVIRIHQEDNVAVALRDFLAQENLMVDGKEISLKEEVKRGHKIALTSISAGGNIIKYGFPIGHAIHSISPGEWVHTHNTKTNLNNVNEYEFHQKLAAPKEKNNR